MGRPNWLSDTTLALVSITRVDARRTIPFMFLVMYAGLEVLPGELFEAAAVDGASRWQAFRFVTVPLLAYIMLVAVLIRGMDAFREFDIIFVLTGGWAHCNHQMLNFRLRARTWASPARLRWSHRPGGPALLPLMGVLRPRTGGGR
jgi:ABC-type sugar transport system permease subunit